VKKGVRGHDNDKNNNDGPEKGGGLLPAPSLNCCLMSMTTPKSCHEVMREHIFNMSTCGLFIMKHAIDVAWVVKHVIGLNLYTSFAGKNNSRTPL
jgi:hypothetical protein